MSESYTSSSGTYQNYLAQRQTDEIKNQISKESNKQIFYNMMSTGYISQKIDNVKHSIERMSTGIQTRLQENTYAIVASATMLQNTFESGFDSINNTLDLGFAGVSNQIGAMSAAMSAGFDKLSKTMDYWGTEICEKLDAIHDIVNNPLLTASRELYRRACQNTTKKFYEEALEDIKGAIEKNKTDYISWGLMGKLYLFGISDFSNVVDVSKAVEAFTNACKYITPDISDSEDAMKMASEFYFYLAYADYILSNESRIAGETENVTKYLQDSVKFNAKAYALSNNMNEALYNQARSNCLLGNKEDALKLCKMAIENDALYSLKATADEDLKSIQNEIFDYLKAQREIYFNNIKKLITEHSVEDYVFLDSPSAKEIQKFIERINELDSELPYLDMRNTLGLAKDIYNKFENESFPIDFATHNFTILPARDDDIDRLSNSFRIPVDGSSLAISFRNSSREDLWKSKLLGEYGTLPHRNNLMEFCKWENDHYNISPVLTYKANRIFFETSADNEIRTGNYKDKIRDVYANIVFIKENHMQSLTWNPEADVIIEFSFIAKDASFTIYTGERIDYREFSKIDVTIKRPGIQKKSKYEKELEEAKIIDDECTAELNRRAEEKKAKEEQNQTVKKSGCYVATCVYGSYDCPQVWTLRRFRDNQLAKTWYGRAFIHIYYAISPILVEWFGQTQWFKNMWKPKLDKMVQKLQSEGVESIPYDDKIW